jgi:pantoate kinase
MIKRLDEKKEKRVEINLKGPEGNSFVLLGYAKQFAKQLGFSDVQITKEMTAGDYENLLDVFEKYFGDYVILYR